MSKHVIIAVTCLMFELWVTILSLVWITSFEEKYSQEGDNVTPRN